MLLSPLSLLQSAYSTLRTYAFNHNTSPVPEAHSESAPRLDSPFNDNPVEHATQAIGSWRQSTPAKLKETDFKPISIPLKTKPSAYCYSLNATSWLAVAEELRPGIAQVLQQHIHTSEPHRTLENIALSPNKQWFAAYSGCKIGLWSIDSDTLKTKTPKLLRMLSAENVTSVTFSPDSKWLAAGNANGTAQMWSIQTDVPTLKQTFSYLPTLRQALHGSTMNRVAFSPDGKWLVSCNGNVNTWSTTTDIPAHSRLSLDDSTHAIAFTPNGRYLAVGSENCSVKIYSLAADLMSSSLSVNLKAMLRK
ncbi:WD40 repeat domain-containing protein [Mycoavidus sp. B2-EB]|uniref:WD40 repeat domain-containing protein n=1 Tax=Mycoavidus sp. B2-EB TaxID=2651972 RepID=UPI00162409D8|nr:hypothetical protein [Mycoavidus sp. B2-EB]BBO60274.1 hypothetical protein MPB2EB_1414 [Mycoavidus sp. B2-EB]